jgi:hypothetical protein
MVHLRIGMYKKKLLLLSLITISSINFCDYPESTGKKIPQEDEIQPVTLLSNLPPEQIIKLLSILAHVDELRLLLKVQENALELENKLVQNTKKESSTETAHQKETDKGFSFTECGIVIRDTFFEEFELRRFSLEFCEGLVKTFKKIVMTKLINETFNGVDFAFGTLPARHIHPNAGIYPVQFLTSGSLSEYFDQRAKLAQQQDPRVRALHQEADQLLQQHNITQALLDAQKRMGAVEKVVEEQDPRVKALRQEEKNALNDSSLTLSLIDALNHLRKLQAAIEATDPKVQKLRKFYQEILRTHDISKAELEVIADLEQTARLIKLADIFKFKKAQDDAQARQRSTTDRVSLVDDHGPLTHHQPPSAQAANETN